MINWDHDTPLPDGDHTLRLFFLLYSIVATALSGVGVVAVLVAGLPGWPPIVAAAALGAASAVGVTWLAARRISTL